MTDYRNNNINCSIEWLQALHDSRKSFYRKAKVYSCGRYRVLVSYSTVVAFISYQNDSCYDLDMVAIRGTYSVTTLRHIKEFLLQNNVNGPYDKQSLLKQYRVTEENFWREIESDFL